MQLTKENTEKLKNTFDFCDEPYVFLGKGSGNKTEADGLAGGGQKKSFVGNLIENLPYELTNAQKKTIVRIQEDMRGRLCDAASCTG